MTIEQKEKAIIRFAEAFDGDADCFRTYKNFNGLWVATLHTCYEDCVYETRGYKTRDSAVNALYKKACSAAKRLLGTEYEFKG